MGTFRSFWLWLAAVFCFVVALLISLGADIFKWTWEPWVTGGFLALAIGGGITEYRKSP